MSVGGVSTATVSFSPAGILQGTVGVGQVDLAPVAAGDYILFNNTAPVRRILNVIDGSTLTIQAPLQTLPALGPVPYQVIRRPRPLLGEEDLTLPDDIVMDFTPNPPPNGAPLSLGVPSVLLSNGASTTQVYEILFSPAGNVIGQNSGGGQIFLWLTNTGLIPAGSYSTDTTEALLIAIQVRTGLVSVNPIGPSANPYQFAQNGRSSGM